MHLGMLHHLPAPAGFPVRALESFILMMKIVPRTSPKKCEGAVQKIAGRIIMYLELVKQLINLWFNVGFLCNRNALKLNQTGWQIDTNV